MDNLLTNDVFLTVVHFFVTFLFSLGFLAVAAMILVYLERKTQGYAQDRYGPLHYGPAGIYLAIIDPLKLFLKEDVKSGQTDSIVFRVAPVVFFAPVITAFVVLPFSPYLTAGAIGTGIIFYVALSSIDVLGIFTHSRGVYRKLGVSDRAGAVAVALREGVFH